MKYILSEPSKREKNSGRKSGGNGKSAETNYRESLVEQKMNWLAKLDPTSPESSELLAELTAESSKADQIQVAVTLDLRWSTQETSLGRSSLKFAF